MKKRIAGFVLGVTGLAVLLAGCGKNEATKAVEESVETEKEGNGDDAETEAAQEEEKESIEETSVPMDKIGILFPAEATDMSWAVDRNQITELFQEAGYDPDIRYADESKEKQISQIRELMAEENIKALVIAPVEEDSLTEVLEEVSELNIPVFDYDDLIMNTDDLKYYVTFDTRAVGQQIGDKIIKTGELEKVKEAGESRTIEFFMGTPQDRAELFLFNGIMEKLQPYFDDGTLVCRSGKITFADAAIEEENPDTAEKKFSDIVKEFYQEEKTPDIICTADDEFAQKIISLIEQSGVAAEEGSWPVISGVGTEAESVKLIAEGKLSFSIYLDRQELSEACVKLVTTYLSDEDPEVQNYQQYDNGVKIIGSVTCDGRMIDGDNYQILVDKGIYREEEIMPDPYQSLPKNSGTAEETPMPSETVVPTETPKSSNAPGDGETSEKKI